VKEKPIKEDKTEKPIKNDNKPVKATTEVGDLSYLSKEEALDHFGKCKFVVGKIVKA